MNLLDKLRSKYIEGKEPEIIKCFYFKTKGRTSIQEIPLEEVEKAIFDHIEIPIVNTCLNVHRRNTLLKEKVAIEVFSHYPWNIDYYLIGRYKEGPLVEFALCGTVRGYGSYGKQSLKFIFKNRRDKEGLVNHVNFKRFIKQHKNIGAEFPVLYTDFDSIIYALPEYDNQNLKLIVSDQRLKQITENIYQELLSEKG